MCRPALHLRAGQDAALAAVAAASRRAFDTRLRSDPGVAAALGSHTSTGRGGSGSGSSSSGSSSSSSQCRLQPPLHIVGLPPPDAALGLSPDAARKVPSGASGCGLLTERAREMHTQDSYVVCLCTRGAARGEHWSMARHQLKTISKLYPVCCA